MFGVFFFQTAFLMTIVSCIYRKLTGENVIIRVAFGNLALNMSNFCIEFPLDPGELLRVNELDYTKLNKDKEEQLLSSLQHVLRYAFSN